MGFRKYKLVMKVEHSEIESLYCNLEDSSDHEELSVIMTVFERINTDVAINSILNQTHENLELILWTTARKTMLGIISTLYLRKIPEFGYYKLRRMVEHTHKKLRFDKSKRQV